MTPSQCPDLEVLFTELEAGKGPALDHAATCPLCSAVPSVTMAASAAPSRTRA